VFDDTTSKEFPFGKSTILEMNTGLGVDEPALKSCGSN